MRRSTWRIRSEKCVVRRFRRCANVIQCTYTNLDSIAYYRYALLNDGDTMYLIINMCVTAVKVSNFSGHYLRNRSTLDIGVLGYIGIL